MRYSRSAGSPQIPSPVTRMAPNPIRFGVRSPPMANDPAWAAFISTSATQHGQHAVFIPEVREERVRSEAAHLLHREPARGDQHAVGADGPTRLEVARRVSHHPDVPGPEP